MSSGLKQVFSTWLNGSQLCRSSNESGLNLMWKKKKRKTEKREKRIEKEHGYEFITVISAIRCNASRFAFRFKAPRTCSFVSPASIISSLRVHTAVSLIPIPASVQHRDSSVESFSSRSYSSAVELFVVLERQSILTLEIRIPTTL